MLISEENQFIFNNWNKLPITGDRFEDCILFTNILNPVNIRDYAVDIKFIKDTVRKGGSNIYIEVERKEITYIILYKNCKKTISLFQDKNLKKLITMEPLQKFTGSKF
jgi:hypothetical protein